MKFDVVIGNPPFQEGMDDTSDKPLYNYFMDASYLLADKVCLITKGAFLFNAGSTSKKWNQKMLTDKHLKVIYYEQDVKKIFPSVGFKGGVAITYHDESKIFGEIGTFTEYTELNLILSKVMRKSTSYLSEIVYSPESYKLTNLLYEEHPEIKTMTKTNKNGKVVSLISRGHEHDMTTNIFDNLPFIFVDNVDNSKKKYIQILGRQNNMRVFKWVKKEYIKPHDNLYKWKIFFAKSNGAGKFGEMLSDPVIAKPEIGTNQSFISIGAFNTEYEATSLVKYIKSKFLRALLGVLKVTQDNKKSTWSKVPLQDFTQSSDIDWSKSIPEIDQQLYAKYGLSEDEINFIETKVKEME